MSLITLIIDDDPLICFIHKKLLFHTQVAHDPIIFHNGKVALDYLFDKYDVENEYLILLDIHMPVIDGWGFLQEISREFTGCNLHIFIISSSIQVIEQKKALSFSHVVEFMEKPLTAENLEKIKKRLQSINLSCMEETQHFAKQ